MEKCMLVWLGAGADYRTCFELEEEYQQKMQVVQAWIDDYQKRLQPVYDSIEAHLQDRMPDIETEYPLEEGKVSENTDVPDRKSTRLNSSHTVISYAVFCLKKKKKKNKKKIN